MKIAAYVRNLWVEDSKRYSNVAHCLASCSVHMQPTTTEERQYSNAESFRLWVEAREANLIFFADQLDTRGITKAQIEDAVEKGYMVGNGFNQREVADYTITAAGYNAIFKAYKSWVF